MPHASSRLLKVWPVVGCLLVILGAKLWLVARYGSPTPYWDQWDGEAAGLYKPYLEGTLRLSDLFAPHNEHRIFFTRVLNVALLELNGSWDPLLQMAVNAILHILAIGTLLVLLGRALGRSQAVVVAVAAAVLFAIPFGWENTLAGFQSQFYLQLLLTFLAVLLSHGGAVFSLRWWLGAAAAGASFLCSASGALAPVALAGLCAAQIVIGRRCGLREYAGVAVLLGLGVTLLMLVPTLPHHAPLRAQNLGQFLSAFFDAASWPLPLRPLGAVVLHFPMVLFTIRLIRERRETGDPAWLYVALWIWLGLQYVALAYGRAPAAATSRYLDIFALAVLLNLSAVLHLAPQPLAGSYSSARKAATVGWVFAVALAVGVKASATVPKGIAERYETSQRQTENLALFLLTRDIAHLQGKPYLHVPYPNAQRLARLASDPTINAILPADLLPTDARGNRTSSAKRLRRSFGRGGQALLAIGVLLLLSCAISAAGLHKRRAAKAIEPLA